MTDYTKALIASQSIVETLERSGDNIKMGLADNLIIFEEIGCDEFITRSADITFIRSHIY